MPFSSKPGPPGRSEAQRMQALQTANAVRAERARLKKRLRCGEADICAVLAEPPEYLCTAKVCDLVRALPRFGPVKTAKLLERCGVSSAKTVAGLTPRQCSKLIEELRG